MALQDFYFKLPLNTEPIIDDTTLRDGIQMPGLAAGPKDSAKIAQFLSEIGVERIELFHYQEPDKKAAKLIADLNLDLRVAGWCRALKEDIDSAVACGLKEVGISHPVSDLHFKAKWPGKTKEQILANIVDVVEYAAKTCGLRTFFPVCFLGQLLTAFFRAAILWTTYKSVAALKPMSGNWMHDSERSKRQTSTLSLSGRLPRC